MTRFQKVLIFGIGFLLGLIVLSLIPRGGERQKEHPWHEQTAPQGTYPLTFEDDFGREMTLQKQPRWFISLAPSVTEILFAMEMGDHLMAVTQWDAYPEAAKALRDSGASIGNLDTPNRELIAEYSPHLVIGTEHTPLEVYELIANPPQTLAVALKHQGLEDLYQDIALLGRITGVPSKALDLVMDLRGRQQAIEAAVESVSDQPRRRAILLYGIEENLMPGWAPGAGTWPGDMIEAAHAENIAARLGKSWGPVSLEALVEGNPDVILIRDGETPTEAQQLRERIARLSTHPVWKNIEAVREERVVILEAGPLSIPGPRMVEAYAAIAEAIWPGLQSESADPEP